MTPLVRIEDAGLGAEAQVRLVVSGVSDPGRLRSAWAASGATLERRGERIHAVTTVEALARAAGRALGAEEAGALNAALRSAVAAWAEPAPRWDLPGRPGGRAARPLIMGIVNVTPDSFADGGLLYPEGHPKTAVEHARRLVDEGADLLDVGGESSRPGSRPVAEADELERVLPVLEELADVGVPRSIDTTKAAVAAAAVEAGAGLVNDVSGARSPGLLEVVAGSGCAYVLMHTRGTPADMASLAEYNDVVAEVYEFLADGLQRCVDAGIDEHRIAVDPGIGFAKDAGHNLAVLAALRQLRGLGRPVLVGASRKSFLGALLDGAGVGDRLEASLACVATAVTAGATVVRVHDVAASVRVARVAHAVVGGAASWPQPAWS